MLLNDRYCKTRSRLPQVCSLVHASTPATEAGLIGTHKVAAALGSNLGDRFANIETALRLIEHPPEILSEADEKAYATVVDTSFMYETEPMYVTDQPKFINCTCLVGLSFPSCAC